MTPGLALNLPRLASAGAALLMECLFAGLLAAVAAQAFASAARRSTQATRFAIWFSALLSIALIPIVHAIVFQPRGASLLSGSHALLDLPAHWAVYLVIGWAILAIFGMLRIAAGLVHLANLRRAWTELSETSMPAIMRAALDEKRTGGNRRRLRIYTSHNGQGPMALGFFRPAIVIPSWCLAQEGGLSAGELRQVLLHELAHVRRWDDWTNLAQKVARALLFFHPAAWWLDSKISLAREMACDEAVLQETPNPLSYAQCLTRIAERGLAQRSLALVQALAQAAFSRMRHTTARVTRILGSTPAPPAHVSKPVWAVSVAGWVFCLFLACRLPSPVAFTGDSWTADPGLPAIPRAEVVSPPLEMLIRPAIQPQIVPAKFRVDHPRRRVTRPAPALRAQVTSSASALAPTPIPARYEPQVGQKPVVFFTAEYGCLESGVCGWHLYVWQAVLPQGATPGEISKKAI